MSKWWRSVVRDLRGAVRDLHCRLRAVGSSGQLAVQCVFCVWVFFSAHQRGVQLGAHTGLLAAMHLHLLSPPPPPLQVITEVFNWTRNPVEARRLAARREAVLREMLGGRKPLVSPGVAQLMDILQRNQVGSAACKPACCVFFVRAVAWPGWRS